MSVLRITIRILRYQSEESGAICHGWLDRSDCLGDHQDLDDAFAKLLFGCSPSCAKT